MSFMAGSGRYGFRGLASQSKGDRPMGGREYRERKAQLESQGVKVSSSGYVTSYTDPTTGRTVVFDKPININDTEEITKQANLKLQERYEGLVVEAQKKAEGEYQQQVQAQQQQQALSLAQSPTVPSFGGGIGEGKQRAYEIYSQSALLNQEKPEPITNLSGVIKELTKFTPANIVRASVNVSQPERLGFTKFETPFENSFFSKEGQRERIENMNAFFYTTQQNLATGLGLMKQPEKTYFEPVSLRGIDEKSVLGQSILFAESHPFITAGIPAVIASGASIPTLLVGATKATAVGVGTYLGTTEILKASTPEAYRKYLTPEYAQDYAIALSLAEREAGVGYRLGSELFGPQFLTMHGTDSQKIFRDELYRLGRERGLTGKELDRYVKAQMTRVFSSSIGQIASLVGISTTSEFLGQKYVSKSFVGQKITKNLGRSVFKNLAPRIGEAGFAEGFATQIVGDFAKYRTPNITSAIGGGIFGYYSAGVIGGKIGEYTITKKAGQLKTAQTFAYGTDPFEYWGDITFEGLNKALGGSKITGRFSVPVPAIATIGGVPTFTTTPVKTTNKTQTPKPSTPSFVSSISPSSTKSFTAIKTPVRTPTTISPDIFERSSISTPITTETPTPTPVPEPEPTPTATSTSTSIFAPTETSTTTNIFTNVPVTVPTMDFFFPPFLEKGSLFDYPKGVGRKAKQPKGYTPSLTSLSLGIVGKRSKFGEVSGLGLRPIPTEFVKAMGFIPIKAKKKRRKK